MGYWENTTYLQHASVPEIVSALDAVLGREGMQRMASPPQRERLGWEPMQYDNALDNDLWGLAIFPGTPGWCTLKTAPLEVLGERAQGQPHMRLADVCRVLGTSAFQLHTYESSQVLVEVSAAGDVLMSGFAGHLADPMQWNGIEVTEERCRIRFELHALGHLLDEQACSDTTARAIARGIGGANARNSDNLVSVVTLVSHAPLDAADGVAVYYRWSGPTRQRRVSSRTYEQFMRGRQDSGDVSTQS